TVSSLILSDKLAVKENNNVSAISIIIIMRFCRVRSLLQGGGTHLIPFFFIRGRHSTPLYLSRIGFEVEEN
ncbi:MAG: hypothetical protein ACKO7A_04625, partial [Microcystis sp.]